MLSVAVVTYNQEKYISKTLDSILHQEHNYSYEIVIGDDCSTDGTRRIIEKYKERFPEIVKPIYNEVNLGFINNYYNVISHCRGEYIMECGGDDWWLQGKIQQQIERMNESNLGLCYGKAYCYDSDDKYIRENRGCEYESFQKLLQENVIPSITACFRNDLFRKYIEEVKPLEQGWLMEDYPAWLWFSMNSKVFFMPSFLACYRCSENSISRPVDKNKQILFLENTYRIRNFYAEKYGCDVKPVESDVVWKKLMFRVLLKSYDKVKAKYLQGVLVKELSFEGIIKYIIISNKLFAKIVGCFL